MGDLLGNIRAALAPAPAGQMLSSLAPQLFTNRKLLDAFRAQAIVGAAARPALKKKAFSARDLLLIEWTDELCELQVPDDVDETQVSLLDGFVASLPSAMDGRRERRRRRADLVEKALELQELGLKDAVEQQRGLLGAAEGAHESRLPNKKRRPRRSALPVQDMLEATSRDDLERDIDSVRADMHSLAVKRSVVNNQISDIERKMDSLQKIKDALQSSLLDLRQEQLELDDELLGNQQLLAMKAQRQGPTTRGTLNRLPSESSRRRRGPAFLPSEHDDLPPGVAFMTLTGHFGPITAVDFTEPYGMGMSASKDESLKLWDLSSGSEIRELEGHRGVVKCLQVEGTTAVTGGADGRINVWQLDVAEASANASDHRNRPTQNDVFAASAEETDGDSAAPSPCSRSFVAHTKDVTALFFDNTGLVTGSSDRTLRQWDLETGQCVLTMDILWAISNPLTSQSLSGPPADDSASPSPTASPLRHVLNRRTSMLDSPTTTNFSDGSWDMYDDFVGAVQFWGYALASATGDGCVRMWDMRTGQAHRTLVGHTAPVTAVQFDENYLVSGSLDKSIRIWDLRTGSISDTIRYDHPVTALGFDTRKIVAAAGENDVKLFNRTTLQQSALATNGHTSAVEKLRFVDKYLMTGSRDNCVKIWALP